MSFKVKASILAERIYKTSKEINIVWNGQDPDRDNLLENEPNKGDNNIETEDEPIDNTSVEFLDQTFINPSAGFNCNIFIVVAKNKSGLKKHRNSKHTNT